jgi:hypothetical protein
MSHTRDEVRQQPEFVQFDESPQLRSIVLPLSHVAEHAPVPQLSPAIGGPPELHAFDPVHSMEHVALPRHWTEMFSHASTPEHWTSTAPAERTMRLWQAPLPEHSTEHARPGGQKIRLPVISPQP